MARLNWEKANRREREAAQRQAERKERRIKAKPASEVAITYMRKLAEEAGVPVPVAKMSSTVSHEITRLKKELGRSGLAEKPQRKTPPTEKQMRYLYRLAKELDVAIPRPKTKGAASFEIERLKEAQKTST